MAAAPSTVHIKPVSILVMGDALGEFDFIFSRIEAINDRNGPFDLVLFVGDFFGKEGHQNITPYINKEKQIHIESYFITNNCDMDLLHDDGNKICDNLHYLGVLCLPVILSP